MTTAESHSRLPRKETGMRERSNDLYSRDELDLAIETLKDLTPSATQADQVRGGNTTRDRFIENGSA